MNNKTETSDISKKDSGTNLSLSIQNTIDTNEIIKDIKKKYTFIMKRKKFARYETHYDESKNIDDPSDNEYSGDFSIDRYYDTIFFINDSLNLKINVHEEEWQMGDCNSRLESYSLANSIFFQFERIEGISPSYVVSGIRETRTYYYKNLPVRCLYRQVDLQDLSAAEDSVKNIIPTRCRDKK